MNQSLDTAESVAPEPGWRFGRTNPSLPEVYRSVRVPKTGRGWLGILRKPLAFSGPGYLVAVGYMDPGNWATDLAGELAVLLHAPVGGDHLQPYGYLPAASGAQAGGGQQARSGASLLLSPLLGVGVASTLFAVALLASGQNSTLTGTLAGQVVMEGFLRIPCLPSYVG